MKLLKQVLAVLGTVVVIALLVVLVTPKTAHAIVATFVQVVNTPSQPVPTLEADAQTAFVVLNTCNFGDAPDFNLTECEIIPLYTVPAGKTAVIESFSADCQTPPGTATAEFKLIYLGPGGSQGELRIPPSSAVPFGASVLSEAALNLKSYVSAGSPINFVGQANNTSTLSCAVNVSGHLE